MSTSRETRIETVHERLRAALDRRDEAHGGHDVGICGVRWCEEIADHGGPHRKWLFDSFGLDVRTGRAVIFQLWLQGESARVAAPVVVTDATEIGLTWSQASRLVNALSGAIGSNGQ